MKCECMCMFVCLSLNQPTEELSSLGSEVYLLHFLETSTTPWSMFLVLQMINKIHVMLTTHF